MTVCWENLHHAQELQKQSHNKDVKPRSYALGNKVWLNSKYLKNKQKQKLETKFFGPFQVLHPIRKQAYKWELPKKWRIYDVFHILLLKQNTIRKNWVDKKISELDVSNKDSKEYKLEAIWDSTVYAKKSKSHLSGLYYLVTWKDYPKKENTWEPLLDVQHLKKLISSFHKSYSKKPSATSLPINCTPSMARLTIKPTRPIKQKRG